MDIKSMKYKAKTFWDENKHLILIGGTILGTIVGSGVLLKKGLEGYEFPENDSKETIEGITEYDYGRDCLITYSVEDTGEVLWKDRCTESYVNDNKNWGMEYENIRKLNGID